MSAERESMVRTVAGCIVAVIAAVWALQTGEWHGWLVALLGAGVIDPALVARWFRGPR